MAEEIDDALVVALLDPTIEPRRVDSPLRRGARRFCSNRLALVSGGFLVVLTIVVLLAPWTAPHDPLAIDFDSFGQGPSREHLLGTDGSGRDVLSRVIWGGRVSLSVGALSVGIYLVIGVLLGAIAGYFRGVADVFLMRLTDLFLALPTLIILIALVPLLGQSALSIILALGLFGWPVVARLVRSEFLSLREREFVVAAHSMGAGSLRIIFRHILPNVGSSLVVAATFGIADAIIAESGLSLLGLGIQPPEASWGQMLQAAGDLSVMISKPWVWMAPAGLLAITILAVNFVGDGLRDALDPQTVSTVRRG